MKKYLAILAAIIMVVGALIVFNLVKADDNNSSIPPITAGVAQSDLRQSLSIQENLGRNICKQLGTCASIANNMEIIIKAAKVTAVDTNLITVAIFNYTYRIDMQSAKLVRQYWGASSIDEVSVGDIINVWGYLDQSDSYLIHGQTVRDVSIQAVQGVFKGTVDSITPPSTFVLKSDNRGNQTVTVTSDTKITKATSTASFSDLQVGLPVIIRGIWNKSASTVKALTIVIGSTSDVRPFFQTLFQQIKNKLNSSTSTH